MTSGRMPEAMDTRGQHMSDTIIKIIPSAPDFRIPEEKRTAITNFLDKHIAADKIGFCIWDAPGFVDCGGNLERIKCPVCGAELSFDWWGGEMDASHSKSHFRDLAVHTPCCGQEVSLNNLDYYFACGFSSIVLEILNPAGGPGTLPAQKEILDETARMMGTDIRIIFAQY